MTIYPTASFCSFFAAQYRSTTKLGRVCLTKRYIEQHHLKSADENASQKAQELISRPIVYDVLSKKILPDSQAGIRILVNKKLEDANFKILSYRQTGASKFFVPTIIKHPDLPDWIIVAGGNPLEGPFDKRESVPLEGPGINCSEIAVQSKNENLLRPAFSKRIQAVAARLKIPLIVPNSRYIEYQTSDEREAEENPRKKYCVASEFLEDVLSQSETIARISGMAQEAKKKLARQISKLVQNIGYANASFKCIRLNRYNQLVFLNTKPSGLIIARKPGCWNYFFGPSGGSVEKCARIGLFHLQAETANNVGLKELHKVFSKAYKKSLTPEISKKKIALSIATLGLYVIFNAIAALFYKFRATILVRQLKQLDKEMKEKTETYFIESDAPTHLDPQKDNSNADVIKYFDCKEDLPKQLWLKEMIKRKVQLSKKLFRTVENVIPSPSTSLRVHH